MYKPEVSSQYSLHQYILVQWTKRGDRQYVWKPDDSPFLNKIETKHFQSVICSCLYYTRALDCTMLLALNQMSTQRAQPT